MDSTAALSEQPALRVKNSPQVFDVTLLHAEKIILRHSLDGGGLVVGALIHDFLQARHQKRRCGQGQTSNIRRFELDPSPVSSVGMSHGLGR